MMLSLVAAIPHIVVEFGIVISLSSCVNVCRLITIQRLNSNCTVANGVLKESDEVKEPLSICFNKNSDKLYMANFRSYVVHVYTCS
jgi:hypothetical protein